MIKRNLPLEMETNFEFDSNAWILKCLKLLPKFIVTRHLYQVTYKYKRGKTVELKIISLLDLKTICVAEFVTTQFDAIKNSHALEKSLDTFAENWRNQTFPIFHSLYEQKEKKVILSSPGNKLLAFSNFFYSSKNQKEVFEPIIAEWHTEYFLALHKKELWKAKQINMSNTYAFLAAMWQKSPIGDLIEFISKLAK